MTTESVCYPTISTAERPFGAVANNDFAPGIEEAFPVHFEETEGIVECCSGQVPDFVRGTYYLNGPARFTVGDIVYRHWLDGDGMASRLRFDSSGIQFKNRYIRTTKWLAEQAAGRALYRTFGTAFRGDMLNTANNALESPVNVSIFRFGPRLIAFGEQGLPWELDPDTLETRGQCTFGGRLNAASPIAAHPKLDAETGEMFNFGVFFSPQNPRLYFYCFDGAGLRYRKGFSLPYPCSIHDFTLSKSYGIFFLAPYLLDVGTFKQEGASLIDSLRWEPERGSMLTIVNRQSGQMVASIPAGNGYCLHLINSFEFDGYLTVDLLEFDSPIYPNYHPIPNLFTCIPPGRPVRYLIDLRTMQLVSRRSETSIQFSDFPAIDPRLAMQPYDDYWTLSISSSAGPGRKFFDQLVHRKWTRQVSDAFQCAPGYYLAGEPVFVAEQNSSQGVLICQEFHPQTRTSFFLLFDAINVKRGPIARIGLNRPLYLGFHAIFQPKQGQPDARL